MLPCYVINLEKDVERRENISRQLDALGIPYTIFRAINGKTLSAEEMVLHYDKVRAIKEYRPLTPGEIGCALSHRGIYQEIIEKDLPGALILEDDTKLVPDASDKSVRDWPSLPEILGALEKHFHHDESKVILLSYAKRYRKQSCIPLIGDLQIADVYGYTVGAHAYFITNKAARNLIENIYPFRMDCDQWHAFKREGYVEVKAIIPYCIGYSEHHWRSNLTLERVETKKEEKRNFFHYYLYEKFIFQIFVKHILSLGKQEQVW